MSNAKQRQHVRYKINNSLLCDVFEVKRKGLISRLFSEGKMTAGISCRVNDISEFGLCVSMNKDIDLGVNLNVEIRFDGKIFRYDSFQVRNKNASMSDEKMVVMAGLGTTKSLSDLISELTIDILQRPKGRGFLLRLSACAVFASVGSCCWRHYCTTHFTG